MRIVQRGSLAWLAGVLLVVGAAPASAQTFYSNSIAADLGTLTASNDGEPSNTWAFDSTCPASLLAGHTAPGNARWGNPTTCLDYGTDSSTDYLLTPELVVPAGCSGGVRLDFNYLIEFEESACWDRARVEAYIDGAGGLVVSDNGICGDDDEPENALRPRPEGNGNGNGNGNAGFGNLVADGTWRAASVLISAAHPGDLLQVAFVGETGDGLFNGGSGFHVDDVTLTCVPAFYEIPTLGSAGFLTLGFLLGAAGLAVMLRRRRAA